MNIGKAMKGRSASLAVAVLVIASVMGMALAPQLAYAQWHTDSFGGGYDTYVDPGELTGENWMSGLSGGRYLNEINMPGTHDSGCASVWCYHWAGSNFEDDAVTQTLFIEDQLDAGVRYFDLRVTDCGTGINDHTEGDLYLCHGKYYLGLVDGLYFCKDKQGYIETFDSAMRDITLFLHANPSETVICTIKVEYADGKAAKAMERVESKLKKYAADLYTQDRVPRLDEVRGKVVIVGDDSNGKLSYGMQFGKTDSGKAVIGGVVFSYENTCRLNRYDKPKRIKDFFAEENHRLPKNLYECAPYGLLAYTSSSCSPGGDNPREIATEVNKVAYTNVDALFRDKGRHFGWVYSDFVTPATVREFWETNFPDDLDYCTISYSRPCEGGTSGRREKVLRGTKIRVAPTDMLGSDDCLGWMLDGELCQPGRELVATHDLTFMEAARVDRDERDSMSWGDLQRIINEADVDDSLIIDLHNDITAEEGDGPIVIDRRGQTVINFNGCGMHAMGSAEQPRRAFELRHNSAVTLRNGYISDGYADKGSAIYVGRPEGAPASYATGLVLENMRIESSEASEEGGAVYVEASHDNAACLRIAGLVVTRHNTGGGIYLCTLPDGGGAHLGFKGQFQEASELDVTLMPEVSGDADCLKEGLVFTKGLPSTSCLSCFRSDRGDVIFEKDGEAAIKAECHSVTYLFDPSREDGEKRVLVVRDGDTARPLDPGEAPAGNCFKGWCEEGAPERPFDFSTPIKQDTTLCAKWEHSHEPKLVDGAEAERLGIKGVAELVASDREASCEEAGVRTMLVVCPACGEVLETRQVGLAPLGHDWDEWHRAEGATGEHAQAMERACRRCQATEQRMEAKADVLPCSHERLARVEAVEPTCTSSGTKEHYRCEDCARLFADASCEQEVGYDELSVEPLEHTQKWEDIYHQDGCCTEGAHTISLCCCETCGCLMDSREEHAEAAGHHWDEGVAMTEASCTTDGVIVKTCADCGAQSLESVPAMGHDFRWDEHETLDEPGVSCVWHRCARCGLVDEERYERRPTFAEQRVAVSGSIGLEVVVDLPTDEGASWSDSYMDFEVGGRKARVEHVGFADARQEGDGRRVFVCPLSAIEMAEKVKASFHYGDGKVLTKEGLTLQDCIAHFMGRGREESLVHALSDYGYYAQRFLAKERGWKLGVDYAAMDSCYKDVDALNKNALLSYMESFSAITLLDDSSVKKVSCSLEFGSTIALNLRFTVPANTRFRAEGKWSGSAVAAERVSDTCYQIRLEGITADRLHEPIIVHGMADDSFTIHLMPISYAYAAIASGKLSAEGEAALYALCQYHREARLAFN